MKYFLAVVKAGSLSGAAAELNLAQPALSVQIRDLEQKIGVPLLERHSRGIRLTAAGQVLNERAQALDGFLVQMLIAVREAAEVPAEPVVIGLTPSLMRLVGMEILVAAAERGTPIRLVEALSIALTVAVERREIDIAFAYEVDQRRGLVRDPLILDELLYVTAYGGPQGPISFQDAMASTLYFAGQQGIVSLVRRTAERMSLFLDIVANVQSVSAIEARIAEGGASLLSYGTAVEGVQRGILSVRQIERPTLTRTLYLVRRVDNNPAARDPRIAELLDQMISRIHKSSVPYATLIKTSHRPPCNSYVPAAAITKSL